MQVTEDHVAAKRQEKNREGKKEKKTHKFITHAGGPVAFWNFQMGFSQFFVLQQQLYLYKGKQF